MLAAVLAATPAATLGLAVGGYVLVFGRLTWAQQSNFGTFGFDMGIYDQGIWLLSRFRAPFDTVRGLPFFAHHVNVIALALVPLYWLGGGPHALYLVETLALAAGAVPLWLLARDRLDGAALGGAWLGVGLAASYLLYPSLEWINWWHFHPDALIITPLLFAWWLASRRRWGWFVAAVAVALACKEDAALAVATLGVVLAIRGIRSGDQAGRRVGLLTMIAGAGWFLAAVKLIIPLAGRGRPPFYVAELFPGLGSSLGGIIANLVTHPSRFLSVAVRPDRLIYYGRLLAPVAFLPLVGLPALLVGVPQTAVNVISAHPGTHDPRFHYTSIVLAAIFLGTVEACPLLTRAAQWAGRRAGNVRQLTLARWVPAGLVALVLAASLWANVRWSPSPLSPNFHSGIWAQPQPRHAAMRRALRLVPPAASVTATYYLVPHLTHRTQIYEWPNPWIVRHWGVAGEDPPDPGTVRYLVVDTGLLGDGQALYARLTGPGGPFRVIFDEQGIVVAVRAAPGPG